MKIKKNNKLIVGKVYALWCQYCIKMAPVFQKIKMEHKYRNTVDFVEIQDNELEQKKHSINNKLNAPNKLEVNGFPTIFLIKNGNIHYFQGNNTDSAEMEKWIDSFISPPPRRTKKGGRKVRKSRHLFMRKRSSATMKAISHRNHTYKNNL